MKKTLNTILGGAFTLFLFVGAPMIAAHFESTYTRDAKVIAVDANSTFFVDGVGEVWEWESTDFEVGQEVVLKMFDNLTMENIYDDSIIKVLDK